MEKQLLSKYFYIAAFKRGATNYEWIFENYAYAITRETVELSDIVSALYFADPEIAKTICDHLNELHGGAGFRFAVCELMPRVYFTDDNIYRMDSEVVLDLSNGGNENG